MENICDLSLEQLLGWMKENGEKSFYAKQILQWIYQKKAESFLQMTNLSKDLRNKLSLNFRFPSIQLVKIESSKEGETEKFLFRLSDQKLIESVLIYGEDRATVCVSSQVGCPARCAFCASGKEGLFRNLKAAEIIEQVLFINRFLGDKNVTHIVFMGMGEPLENYDEVVKAVGVFTSEMYLNISQRRITISTVGLTEKIKELANEPFRVNLALSLHAPNEHIRKKIIPYARKYPLEEILEATHEYHLKTKRDITYEYTLIENINDQVEHAKELSYLLRKGHCTVNLIPYNPVPGLNLNRPSNKAIVAFYQELRKNGVVATQRYTKGTDTASACGQLALKKE